MKKKRVFDIATKEVAIGARDECRGTFEDEYLASKTPIPNLSPSAVISTRYPVPNSYALTQLI
jgi:hypothetical protein